MPPSFCRHNRFLQNCPICSPAATKPPPAARRVPGSAPTRSARGASRPARSGAVRVRQLSQAADDGYRSELVTGLKATADAERLASELAFASARLAELAADPPGLYADVLLLDDADFAQRYSGRLSADGTTIVGAWEICDDGATWAHDFDLTYTKVV